MGVLSDNAGLLGGLGQGMQINAANQRAERLEALRHEREVAVRKMENEQQSAENQKNRDLTASEGSKNRQVQVGEMRTRADEGKADREQRERESALNRESAEKIAGMRAAATASGRNPKKRFTTNKVANESVSKGEVKKTEEVVLTDNTSGQTYKQQGDMFVLQGATPRPHKDRRAAEDRLRANPGTASDFASHFGYLPAWFVAESQNEVSNESFDEEE